MACNERTSFVCFRASTHAIQDLKVMATSFNAKRRAGLVTAHGSGYGGTGFKFDREEADKTKLVSALLYLTSENDLLI